MIKKIDSELQIIVDGWLVEYNAVFPKINLVPDLLLQEGYLSFVDEKPTVATYVFKNESVAFMAWTTANPEIRGDDRDYAFKDLFDYVQKKLKDDGVKIIFASATNPSLLKRFYDQNFVVLEYDMVQMLKVL